MKLIVCGGRNWTEYDKIYFVLNGIRDTYGITEIVNGGATGVDYCARIWADNSNIPLKTFPADWDKYRLRAGPIRNQLMAEYADGCIAFPGGKGTDDMFNKANERKLQVWDFRQKEQK